MGAVLYNLAVDDASGIIDKLKDAKVPLRNNERRDHHPGTECAGARPEA